ncbi:MAG: DUF4435 domain-containing protein [Oscillospiraceae bacterium]|nr:DUF4435 domain-containing protein [Oscillospiraceae bacterium]
MNDNIDGLQFSPEGLANRPLFLSALNDINLFVEDIGKEYAYEEIFERLFENQISVFSIFPLGGKSAVIGEHSRRQMLDSDGKLNIFIVDGDFDNLWEDQKINSPNLIYLTRYNIESYYCSTNAVIRSLRSLFRCTRRAVESKVNIDDWRKSLCNELGKLFILFATVNHNRPTLKNVSLGPGKFLDEQGQLIAEEYDSYLQMVSAEIGGITPLMDEVTDKIRTQFEGDEESRILSIICGKYQFESLSRKISVSFSKNINRENFRNSLISSFDLEPLLFLKNQILKLYADSILQQNSA